MRKATIATIFGLAILGMLFAAAPVSAQVNGLPQVAVCGSTQATGANCIQPNADGSVNLVGDFDIGNVGIADGADEALGAKADSSCGSDAGTCSLIAIIKRLAASITTLNGKIDTLNTNVSTGAIPSGTNPIGSVAVSPTVAAASTPYGLQSAASTNATSVKASAGVITAMTFLNTTTTTYYLRTYNLASAPTCSSATGFVRSWPIPPGASSGLVGGVVPNPGATGTAFSTGIAFCLTGGGSSIDNTNAATGVYVNIDYK